MLEDLCARVGRGELAGDQLCGYLCPSFNLTLTNYKTNQTKSQPQQRNWTLVDVHEGATKRVLKFRDNGKGFVCFV
jgi:hypothetical protein